MKQWQIRPGDAGPALIASDVATPEPGPGDVRVEVHATSLNYRDHLLATGRYPGATLPVVPVSDGAGIVTAVGPGVTDVSLGDRVVGMTLPCWLDGDFDPRMRRRMIGFAIDGWLQDEVVMPDTALVRIPDGMSFASAATLPCAGVTAWNAVIETGRIGPGDSLVTLGTGGVSMFAVQLGKLVGARVTVTSSSDDKLARAQAVGADDAVNYRRHPDWHTVVRELTGDTGVDLVVETVGDMDRSTLATRWGGLVAVVGLLAHYAGNRTPDDSPERPPQRNARVTPILMGPRRMLARLVRAYASNGVAPVIDRAFPLAEPHEAFNALASARHIGKIVLTR